MSNFDSTKTRLHDLLKEIKQGTIQLPDFQRGWVWDDEHIRSLLVSIARMFPVGAVMLLESGGEAKFKVRPVEGLDPNQVGPNLAEKLILDGQQRLTSLTQVLALDNPVKTRDAKKKEMLRYYYINITKALEGPKSLDEAFIGVDENKCIKVFGKAAPALDLSTPEKEYELGYFPCNRIFDAATWQSEYLKFHQFAPEKTQQFIQFFNDVLQKFTSYDVPVIKLFKSNTKEAVCLVFEKVNTGGVPLSVFELITATYAAHGVNLRDDWFGSDKDKIEGIRKHLNKQKLLRSVEPTDFFQGLSLLHTYETRLQDLAAGKTGKFATGVSAKREAVLGLPLEAYQKYADKLKSGFWEAAKFLRRESFFSTKELPYRTQLVPLAAVLTVFGNKWLEPQVYKKISQWFWCGVLGELYGGAVETRFALDLQELVEWCNNTPGAEEPTTVKEANFQSGRLDTLRSRTSAAYKGLSVLVQRRGARDFFWQSTIKDLNETDWEDSKLDIHHIFPKKWCEANQISPRQFNSILNKTPISFKANRMIGGHAPSVYLPKIEQHSQVKATAQQMNEILESHLIDSTHLRADNYFGFIEARRLKFLELIAEVMGKEAQGGSDSADAYEDEMDEMDEDGEEAIA